MFLIALAMGCGDEPGAVCANSRDCAAGAICIDGECRPTRDGGVSDATSGDGSVPNVCLEDCGEQVCVGGQCCDLPQACGDVCCGDGDICSFGACVPIGSMCVSDGDCEGAEYCEPTLGDSTMMCNGQPSSAGRCLPRPMRCPDGVLPDPVNPTCVATCTFEPSRDEFGAELTYSWGEYDGDVAEPNLFDIRSSPIVIQLDDDDCDGQITARDIPEIVITTAPNDTTDPDYGDLVVLSVQDGALTEKWRVPRGVEPHRYLAAGNIDGQPGNEIVACRTDPDDESTNTVAYRIGEDGPELLWESDRACVFPSIADFDRDGRPEVLVRQAALNGVDGTDRFTFDAPAGLEVIAADVDNDPLHTLEVVSAGRVFRLVGNVFTTVTTFAGGGQFVAVADLELGGLPEIVSADFTNHQLHVWRYSDSGAAEVVRMGLDVNGRLDPALCAETSTGFDSGGGPPTIADVNADGVPDVAIAGGVGYAVLDGAKLVDSAVPDLETFFWVDETIDCSSAQTGSSVFDFNGDGRAEVLYADEHTFKIYEGMTGNVLFSACSTNGTIREYPIVSDIDGDDQADIIVVSNARYRACMQGDEEAVSGVRVYGTSGGQWVRTRRVWNQHSYHITNVEEDGTIPREEPANFMTPGLNNFRTNRQPGTEFSAVDAVVRLEPSCSVDIGIAAIVRNLGEGVLPPGAQVELFEGTVATPGVSLGAMTTSLALYPSQSERIVFPVSDPAVLSGTQDIFARVTVPPAVPECRPDNNTAQNIVGGCLI